MKLVLFFTVGWPVVQVSLLSQERSDGAPSPASGESPMLLPAASTPTLPRRSSDPVGPYPTHTRGHHFFF